LNNNYKRFVDVEAEEASEVDDDDEFDDENDRLVRNQ